MKYGVLYCTITLLALFGCYSERVSELCKKNYSNDESYILNVAVDVKFRLSEKNLIANITYKNCSNEPLFFLPSDLGQDPDDTYKYFYIGKLELLNETDKYISHVKFIQSSERTQYQEKLSSGKVSKIKLEPGQEFSGEFNLSKRYEIQSGLYIVEFGATGYDFTSHQSSENDVLWRISSSSYLVDIDIKNNKILYVRSLQEESL